NPGNNLHVSGLSHKIDTRDLEAAFAKTGRVQKASVMYDPHTRESRGFRFVMMETPEEAEAAVAALHGTELGGKAIHVEKVGLLFFIFLGCAFFLSGICGTFRSVSGSGFLAWVHSLRFGIACLRFVARLEQRPLRRCSRLQCSPEGLSLMFR
ncbi:hypothetical protein DFH06DRAFT_1023567, partial [Mycena polygramma]